MIGLIFMLHSSSSHSTMSDTSLSNTPVPTYTRVSSASTSSTPASISTETTNKEPQMASGKETMIAPKQRLVETTSISDNYVTWSENSANVPHIYDISKKQVLSGIQDSRVNSKIETDNKKAVWSGEEEDVTLYDISTRKETKITNDINTGMTGINPDISGDNIIYAQPGVDQGYYYTHILLYNIATKKTDQLTIHDLCEYQNAKIYGDKAIWTYTKDVKSSIYVYKIDNHAQCSISRDGQVSSPEMCGDYVVWSELRGATSDIYLAKFNFDNYGSIKEWLKNNSKFSFWECLSNSIFLINHQRQYR